MYKCNRLVFTYKHSGLSAIGIKENVSKTGLTNQIKNKILLNNKDVYHDSSVLDADGITNKYALVIGTDPGAFCEDDAIDMSNVLEDKGWSVKVYKNLFATKENILSGIQWLADISDNDDIVLFFFSGHGATRVIADRFNQPIFLIRLKIAFSAISPLTTQVLIFDTCHAGSMSVGADVPNFKLKYFNYNGDYPEDEEFENDGFFGLNGTGRVVIALCRGFQYSYGDPGFQNGIFTHYFIKGLSAKDTDTNGNGWISATEALEYAKPRTRQRGMQYSLMGQWPMKVKDNNLGQVDLIKIGDGEGRNKIFLHLENFKLLNSRIMFILRNLLD